VSERQWRQWQSWRHFPPWQANVPLLRLLSVFTMNANSPEGSAAKGNGKLPCDRTCEPGTGVSVPFVEFKLHSATIPGQDPDPPTPLQAVVYTNWPVGSVASNVAPEPGS
jgi:hypothetical protein